MTVDIYKQTMININYNKNIDSECKSYNKVFDSEKHIVFIDMKKYL